MVRTWWVAAALAATTLVGVADAAPCGRAAAERARTWFVAVPPLPDQGTVRDAYSLDPEVRAVALDPADGRTVFVTDSANVHRSDDGGCTWTRVWTVGADDPVAEVTSLDVARVGGKPRLLMTVFTATYFPFGRVARTRIVRSDDGRAGWRTVYDDIGVVAPEAVDKRPRVRSGAGGTAYALVPSPSGAMVYLRSRDATTWEVRTPVTDLEAPLAVGGLAVSPWNPDELWDWNGGPGLRGATSTPPRGLRRSTDGARTWQYVNPWPMLDQRPSRATYDVAWPVRGGPARILVLGGTKTLSEEDPTLKIAWSGDGGATFALAVPPKRLAMAESAVTHTPRGDAVVVTQSGVVYRIPHTGRLPRREDWRSLPRVPHRHTTEWSFLDSDLAVATATTPTVVLSPTYQRLQLLTVRP